MLAAARAVNAAEVKAEMAAANDRLARARAEVRKVQADMDAISAMCPHEGARHTSHMGENCRHCYDCETCDV